MDDGRRGVWLPDLADATLMGAVLAEHAEVLGVAGPVAAVELHDVRLTHPHRPESPRARGWATYVLTTQDGAPTQLYVKGFPDAATAEAAWRDDRTVRPDGRSVRLASHDLVVWPFPDDPRLTALPSLMSHASVSGLFPAVVRDLLGAGEPHATMVRYQPEVSATIRFDSGREPGPTVFAKHLAGVSVAEVATRHQALWLAARRSDRLRIAEPLGADPDRGVLWTRGAPGRPLTAALTPAGLGESTAPVGALLAALHATEVDAPALTLDDLEVEMVKKAAKLAHAHPPIGEVVSDLVSAAQQCLAKVRHERAATLHGDFHLDQLVAAPTAGPVLVDLDSMVRGAPEIDLAEFLVDLALRGFPDRATRAVAVGLLSSYAAEAAAEMDSSLLRFCADAEFVNRCYRHLRRHAPGWQDALTAELARHPAVVTLLPS